MKSKMLTLRVVFYANIFISSHKHWQYSKILYQNIFSTWLNTFVRNWAALQNRKKIMIFLQMKQSLNIIFRFFTFTVNKTRWHDNNKLRQMIFIVLEGKQFLKQFPGFGNFWNFTIQQEIGNGNGKFPSFYCCFPAFF